MALPFAQTLDEVREKTTQSSAAFIEEHVPAQKTEADVPVAMAI